jgi:hypothetical protein
MKASLAHHTHATRRFRPGVNNSIASAVIDLNGTTELDKVAWDGAAVYHHIDFEPEAIDLPAAACKGCGPGPAPERAPRFAYALSSDGSSLSPGTLQLRSIELTQFADRLDSEYAVSSSFLIFHVVGQNLSSTELDAISRALTRPRNRIRGCTPQHPDVTEIGQHDSTAQPGWNQIRVPSGTGRLPRAE